MKLEEILSFSDKIVSSFVVCSRDVVKNTRYTTQDKKVIHKVELFLNVWRDAMMPPCTEMLPEPQASRPINLECLLDFFAQLYTHTRTNTIKSTYINLNTRTHLKNNVRACVCADDCKLFFLRMTLRAVASWSSYKGVPCTWIINEKKKNHHENPNRRTAIFNTQITLLPTFSCT